MIPATQSLTAHPAGIIHIAAQFQRSLGNILFKPEHSGTFRKKVLSCLNPFASPPAHSRSRICPKRQPESPKAKTPAES